VAASLFGVLLGGVIGYIVGYAFGTWALRNCDELDCVWVYSWGIGGALIGAVVIGIVSGVKLGRRKD
jgi:xanthine/uracil permease